MAWSRMGLNRRPFSLTADVDAFFPGSPAEEALTAISTAFDRREGFALIDGPAGVGKTYATLTWLERLDPAVQRVWLPNTHSSHPADLLQAILFDLNQPYEGLGEQELRLAVTAQLLESLRTGQPLVVVIDEAQHLGAAALEELRLLSNIDSRYGKGLFALLIAQSGLRQTLKQPAYEAFAQRITTRCEMEPLSETESRDYLAHHIRLVGSRLDALMTSEAVDLLVENGHGLPRRLSLIAGQAFDVADAAEAHAIDAEVVLEALEQMGLDSPEDSEESAPSARLKIASDDAHVKEDEPVGLASPKKPTRRRSA